MMIMTTEMAKGRAEMVIPCRWRAVPHCGARYLSSPRRAGLASHFEWVLIHRGCGPPEHIQGETRL